MEMENTIPAARQVEKTNTSIISTLNSSRDNYLLLSDKERQSLKPFLFVWLDSNIGESHEIETAIQILQKNVTLVFIMEDGHEREIFMKLGLDNKIVLIVSYECVKQIMPDIYNLTSIITIYVYCLDYKGDLEWMRNYRKIREVIFNINELTQKILKDWVNIKGMEKLTHQHSFEPDMASDMEKEVNLEVKVQPGMQL
jgi:hypothetical protein